MVLYKRKQVTFSKPPPLPEDLSTEVFHIAETKEWFLAYEDYLSRLDYYRRRKFVCEITGNSCLTFFEALESEVREIKGVEKNFPEALREHILRFLQFNRITRLDQLVDKVYSVFKSEYFPGETIFIKGVLNQQDTPSPAASSPPVTTTTGETIASASPQDDDQVHYVGSAQHIRSKGVIREKVQYSNPSDGLTTKYLVSRNSDGQQAIVTKDNISRDRNHFTKWLIKTFIKLTMSRSHKVGAPWVVKQKFAIKYRIPQDYPEDLKHFQSSTPTGEILYDEPKSSRRPQSSLPNNNASSAASAPTPAARKDKDPATNTSKPPKAQKQPTDPKDKVKKTKKSTPATTKPSKKKAGTTSSISSTSEGKGAPKYKPIAPYDGINASGMSPSPLATPPPLPPQPKREDPRKKFPVHHIPELVQQEIRAAEEMAERASAGSNAPSLSVTLSSFQPTKKTIVDDLDLQFDLQNSKPKPDTIELPENARVWNQHLVENLQEDVESDYKTLHKLQKNKQNNMEIDGEVKREEDDEVQSIQSKIDETNLEILRLSHPNLSAVQEALETWAFINIYHSVLKIDTFTFDDFLYAMGWNHDQFEEVGRCELLDEIWCAVLGGIVSNKIPTGKDKAAGDDDSDIFGLEVVLPPKESFINPPVKQKNEDDDDNDDDDHGSETDNEEKTLKSDDDDDEHEDESGNESDNNLSAKNTKKAKKNGKNNDADNEADAEDEDEDEDEDAGAAQSEDEAAGDDSDDSTGNDNDEEDHGHNAYMVMNYRGTPWHERLRRRNFKDGNWQCIVLGVLSMLEHVNNYKPIIDNVYRTLAPSGMTPSPTNVLTHFYSALDIDLKLQTLSILTNLLATGTLVRDYIDESLDLSTTLRRNRLDNIRDYKAGLDAAQKLHQQIHDRLAIDIVSKANAHLINNTKVPPIDKNALDKPKEGIDKPNYIPYDPKKKPRLNFQQFEMIPEEASLAETDGDFKALWENRKKILLQLQELRQVKRDIESKLTEVDCQRVKLLGKDRLFNRYWWFENNGLPNLHASSEGDDNDDDDEKPKNSKHDDEDASDDDEKDEVSEETYLMGRLWIQGPTIEDMTINLHTNFEEADRFVEEYSKFQKNYEKQNNAMEEGHPDPKQEVTVIDLATPDSNGESAFSGDIAENGTHTLDPKTSDGEHKDNTNEPPVDPVRFLDLKDGKPPLNKMYFKDISEAFKHAALNLYSLDFQNDSIEDSTLNASIKQESNIKLENNMDIQQEWYKDSVIGKQVDKPNTIIGNLGLLNPDYPWTKLSPVQRKIIEEHDDPTFNGNFWRYYDKPEQIAKLVQWLNPWGKRESQLRKELMAVKDAITSSIEARRKALWIDTIPESESKLENQLKQINARIYKLENGDGDDVEVEELDSDDSDVISRKRNLRSKPGQRKRQKTMSIDEVIEVGTVEELNTLQTKLSEELTEKREERESSRALEWVNSNAIERFDKSLYDGGDKKLKGRPKKLKK